MTDLSVLQPYLGNLEQLGSTGSADGSNYVQPALKNLGTIAIPIVREIISPASFRNSNVEITDITVGKVRRVRAVANKFKYGERRRGLQVLRHFGAGGAMALNRTDFEPNDPVSKGYDLNTLVFGDSANRGKYVLPVKAGVQYSDAISLAPYAACVDETFHNRATEDGSLWDAVNKQNSVNLFDRHFVVPGTLLLQVLTVNGRTLPPEAFSHLLLCIGLAGAYGGQTSIYGINVRNHVVGIYGAKMERAVASPYEAVRIIDGAVPQSPGEAVESLDRIYSEAYTTRIGTDDIASLIDSLVEAVERDDEALRKQYRAAHHTTGAFFDAWFGTPSAGKPTRSRGRSAEAAAPAGGEV